MDSNNFFENQIPEFPESLISARLAAVERAGGPFCELSLANCSIYAPIIHQIEQRYIISSGYKDPKKIQTADNLLVLCLSCHKWIHNNKEEATALGYLDR